MLQILISSCASFHPKMPSWKDPGWQHALGQHLGFNASQRCRVGSNTRSFSVPNDPCDISRSFPAFEKKGPWREDVKLRNQGAIENVGKNGTLFIYLLYIWTVLLLRMVFFCTSNPKQPCVANPDMLLSYTDKLQVPFLTLSLQKYHHQPSFHHLGVVCTALRWRLWGWPIPANTTFANNSHTPWWS